MRHAYVDFISRNIQCVLYEGKYGRQYTLKQTLRSGDVPEAKPAVLPRRYAMLKCTTRYDSTVQYLYDLPKMSVLRLGTYSSVRRVRTNRSCQDSLLLLGYYVFL